MKIAIDFDGVLSHTMKAWVALFNDDYGEFNVTLRDISEWGFYEKFGMPKNQAFEIFDNCWRDWKKLEPMEHDLAQKTKMLSNLAHGELDVVTSVNEEYIPQIEKWLRRENCVFRKAIHSKAKHELDYDVYIDDSPQNALDISNAGKIVLMINQPWNRVIESVDSVQPRIIRVYNLYHAIDCIRDLVSLGILQ